MSGSQPSELGLSYKDAIGSKKQLIGRIYKSITQYECLNLKPLFHSQNYASRVMYFATFDQIILPGCLNEFNYKWSVSRENIKVWNKEREVTEWALQHVR